MTHSYKYKFKTFKANGRQAGKWVLRPRALYLTIWNAYFHLHSTCSLCNILFAAFFHSSKLTQFARALEGQFVVWYLKGRGQHVIYRYLCPEGFGSSDLMLAHGGLSHKHNTVLCHVIEEFGDAMANLLTTCSPTASHIVLCPWDEVRCIIDAERGWQTY